jgi:hypothetical protein
VLLSATYRPDPTHMSNRICFQLLYLRSASVAGRTFSKCPGERKALTLAATEQPDINWKNAMRAIASFFDFIFYRTYAFYQSNGESDIPGVYALCVITLFPLLNISSLIFIIIDIFQVKNWNYSKLLLLGCFLLVIILNYYRIYQQVGLRNIIDIWEKTDERRRKRFGTGMVIYLIASIVLLFASIIY